MYFSLFCNYLPLKKGMALHLNKLEIMSPKDALCQVWLKLAKRFWRRRFLNFIKPILIFCNQLPLVKGVGLHLYKIESSSPKDALCQVWLKLAQQFSIRRWKCEKFTTLTSTRQRQQRQILIRKRNLILEPSAQIS